MINAIEIRSLVKRYSAFELGPVNLTVPKGAIYGLIGPNGAGKTTTIDLIFGMGLPDSGQIRVLGLDSRAQEVELKSRAAYMSPELNYQIWGNVEKAIRFVRGFYPKWDDAYCVQLMQAFHLGAKDKIQTLSLGAKTKLSLLLALARKPEVLILDEPLNGLDPISKQQFFSELLKAVEGGERSVLISSHNLADLERFADHIGILQRGKMILEGRTDEIVERFRLADFFTNDSRVVKNRNGLTILKREDNRWRALLDQNTDAYSWLQSQGAQQISLTPMTLEDLFVALNKEEAQ